MGPRSSYAVPFYTPAFAIARCLTVALRSGPLFRAVGEIDPEFDRIVDDTEPQGVRHDPGNGLQSFSSRTSGPTQASSLNSFSIAGERSSGPNLCPRQRAGLGMRACPSTPQPTGPRLP